MNSALMYCNSRFNKALSQIETRKAIYAAFESLEMEIKKLNYMDQINLYSVAEQFLQSLLNDVHDSINPMEVFILRYECIVNVKNETIKKIGLALGVLAIALSVVVFGGSIGLGIGILMGLWQTLVAFMTCLLAAEMPALIVVSTSATLGVAAGLVSGFMFFKEPSIKKSLGTCIQAVKQSHVIDGLLVERECRRTYKHGEGITGLGETSAIHVVRTN